MFKNLNSCLSRRDGTRQGPKKTRWGSPPLGTDDDFGRLCAPDDGRQDVLEPIPRHEPGRKKKSLTRTMKNEKTKTIN